MWWSLARAKRHILWKACCYGNTDTDEGCILTKKEVLSLKHI